MIWLQKRRAVSGAEFDRVYGINPRHRIVGAAVMETKKEAEPEELLRNVANQLTGLELNNLSSNMERGRFLEIRCVQPLNSYSVFQCSSNQVHT